MSDAELQTYRDQLAFVNLSLDADPENDDLLSLKTELLEIIELTEAAMGPAAGSSSKGNTGGSKGGADTGGEGSKDKGKGKEVVTGTASNINWQDQGTYKAGMDCMAKYKDGKMYPARINAVIGSQDSPLYTITFKGYSSSTNVPLSSLRPHDPSAPIPQPQKRPATEMLSEKEKEKKKRKGDKWVASQAARTEDMKEKKSAWDKFGKKAAKKGIHIAGLQGKSEFRTPEAAAGRVGVVGSGKPATQYSKMGKHKFQRDEE